MTFVYTLARFGRCENGPDGVTWRHWPSPSSSSVDKVTLSYSGCGRGVVSEKGCPIETFDLCYGVGRHRLFYRDATILFLLNEKEENNRKVRVLFRSVEDCNHFRKLMEQYLPVEEIPEASGEASPKPPNPPLSAQVQKEEEELEEEEEGEEEKEEDEEVEGEEEEEEEKKQEETEEVELDIEALDGLVRLCLLDPKFPSLVTAVEKCLRKMLEEEEEEEDDDDDNDNA